jgi:hypothetical protein
MAKNRRMIVGVATVLLSLFAAAPGKAQDIEDVIVAIECRDAAGNTSQGSGVVISADGRVLTARHVIYGDKDTPLVNPVCRGSTRLREPSDYKTMTPRQIGLPIEIDAAMLQFSNLQNQPYAKYCKSLQLRGGIFVAGFPKGQLTGVASFRQGVLSTVFPDSRNIVETDGQTISGMSGGPVFSKNLKGLVGLVIGAEFTNRGVSYYGILPVNEFAAVLNLTPSEEACYHDSNVVMDAGIEWKSGEATKKLGVKPGDGVCFLSRVFGNFNDTEDSVAVRIEDGEYVLTGNDNAGGGHGGVAQCYWND